jgi:hypothetical protein
MASLADFARNFRPLDHGQPFPKAEKEESAKKQA